MKKNKLTDVALLILCAVFVPLSMAPRQKPEKITTGPIKPTGAAAPSVIEERDGADTLTRQAVYGGGTALWQILADGSSQYFHEDPRGNMVMLTEGAGSPTAAAGDILERVAYDAYGKPFFQDAANQDKTDGGGNFLAQSDLSNTLLYMGRWYDPETGSRARTPSSDRGGLYDFGGRFLDPDEGRFITRFADGDPDRPIITGRYGFAGHAPVNASAITWRPAPRVPPVEIEYPNLSRKIRGYRTVSDVTLKRGVVGDEPGHADYIKNMVTGGGFPAPLTVGGDGEDIGGKPGSPGGEGEIILVGSNASPAKEESLNHLRKAYDLNPNDVSSDGEFWFDGLVPGATSQATYPTIKLEKAIVSSHSTGSASDDSGLFWFTRLTPGSPRARHRMFAIIDRSVPTFGKHDGSSSWIRDSQPWPGKVVVKGKNILEN